MNAVECTAPSAVAVLMAVYKGDDPNRFKEAIASVINQRSVSPTKIRVYLGVDGPLPQSLEAAVQSASPSIFQMVRFETNQGLGKVLNHLVKTLDDEAFVFRMDSDDVSHPDRFYQQLTFLAKNPEIDILGTAIREINTDTGHTCLIHYPKDHFEARKGIPYRTPVAHPTVCMRRHVLEELGGYPDIAFNEDIALWFRAMEKGHKFANLSEPLLDFSVSPAFFKRRSGQKAVAEFSTYLLGTYRLFGLTPKLAWPFVRLALRLAPSCLQKRIYELRLGRKEKTR